MRRLLAILLSLLVMGWGSLGVAQQGSNRLIGRPLAKASCDTGGCLHEQLSPEDQAKYEMVITESPDGRYYWTSREDKVLNRTQSGIFSNYVDPGGSGYTRVTVAEGNCLYTEHLTLALQSVSYWGVCEQQ